VAALGRRAQDKYVSYRADSEDHDGCGDKLDGARERRVGQQQHADVPARFYDDAEDSAGII